MANGACPLFWARRLLKKSKLLKGTAFRPNGADPESLRLYPLGVRFFLETTFRSLSIPATNRKSHPP